MEEKMEVVSKFSSIESSALIKSLTGQVILSLEGFKIFSRLKFWGSLSKEEMKVEFFVSSKSIDLKVLGGRENG